MSFHSRVTVVEMVGTGSVPEVIQVGGYTKTQVEISGRATGNVAIKPKGFGGDVFVDSDPAMSLDLSIERGAAFLETISALEFTTDTTGAYTVTVTETLTT